MEPNYSLTNLLVFALPFACYFLGIIIRKKAMPGKNSPTLGRQLLIGIPVSLVVVSPMVPVIIKTIGDIPAVLVSMGIIMEHGMLVNETLTKQLSDKIPAFRTEAN